MLQCLLSACHFGYSNRFANGMKSIINIDGDHTSAVTQTDNNIANYVLYNTFRCILTRI